MSDETQINESSILEERKKKLKLLRDQNKAYINNFVRKDLLSNILKQYHSLSKDDLELKESFLGLKLTNLLFMQIKQY